MVSVITINVEGHGFDHRSAQAKNCQIGICYFSATNETLSRPFNKGRYQVHLPI